MVEPGKNPSAASVNALNLPKTYLEKEIINIDLHSEHLLK